jgi:tripeptide aminopeptidase
MNLVDRFFKYISFNTTSDSKTNLTPSTPGQLEFAYFLSDELKSIGLKEVNLDTNGYVTATLPANTDNKKAPVVGFISHMDTSPDMTAKHVHPQIIKNYDGNDIILNEKENIILSSTLFSEIKNYVGQDIVVTNGKTLLGADDKAGLAEIVTAMEYLIKHPEIKHGKIRVAFTPDEEIGKGTEHFDVKAFGADWAYTMDGGQIGELEFENFNAAGAEITFKGRNVHPGYAKHKMINSMRIANLFISMLPRSETPEHTEGYEGFYHLTGITGTVEETKLNYIIRDHDHDRFERRKKEIQHLVNKIASEYGNDTISIEIKDQYYNMREKIEPVMHIVTLVEKAMNAVGVTPVIKPIRGGTDGSHLSYKGLPCPNIFAGGHNFHGKYEYVPIQSMEKAVEVIVKIAELAARN